MRGVGYCFRRRAPRKGLFCRLVRIGAHLSWDQKPLGLPALASPTCERRSDRSTSKVSAAACKPHLPLLFKSAVRSRQTSGSRQTVLNFSPSQVFSQMLRNTSKEVALLYDATTERSWIVPKLSLLLHMCHVWQGLHKSDKASAIPFAEPHRRRYDGGPGAGEPRRRHVCGEG